MPLTDTIRYSSYTVVTLDAGFMETYTRGGPLLRVQITVSFPRKQVRGSTYSYPRHRLYTGCPVGVRARIRHPTGKAYPLNVVCLEFAITKVAGTVISYITYNFNFLDWIPPHNSFK
jgi:hypothetical protein